MAPLSAIYIGKHARALAAALALGAAVLSLSTGPTAYAARAISTEPSDTEPAADMPTHRITGRGTATRTNDPGKRCTITSANGHVDFYLPGTVYTRDGHNFLCGYDGQWRDWGKVGSPDTTTVGGGGVATRTP